MFIIAAVFFAAIHVSHGAPLREQQFQFSIGRGTLSAVLEQFAQQTNLHVGAEITASQSHTQSFGPFSGYATADDAMRELLRDTDLWYAWRSDTLRVFLVSAQRTSWSSGVVTAREASDSIHGLAGIRFETGRCSNLFVGPFSSDEPISAEAFWVELIKRHCPVITKRSTEVEPGTVDRQTAAGQARHAFALPQSPRILALQAISQQAGVVIDYVSADAQEEQATVGPLSGSMSLNEALRRVTTGTLLRIRWIDDARVSIEPAYTESVYADMSRCPCNFGLPEIMPLETQNVEVIRPRLPPEPEFTQVPRVVLDRNFINAAGASTIPQLLNYFPQQPFSRQRAHRSNAAQYFEGRGFGAQYPLVLIDGHRAYGSAGDPMTNAFDLNMVPLSAVERIDIALDQPSLRFGTDAIGGTVNIVLKREFDEPAITVSMGSVEGGADRKGATVLADHQWQTTKAGFVIDYLERDALLGSKRDRWRNQDFRDEGGQDYRFHYGAPPTVSSIPDSAGTPDLPGFAGTSADMVIGPGGVTLGPVGSSWLSPQAYAAIEPEQERSTLYGFAETILGGVELKFSVLFGHQLASLQLFPESVTNLRWSTQHPQNPFDTDVNVSALLTGLPPRTQEATSTLQRYSMDLKGFFGRWEYSAFLSRHEDKSRLWIANLVDQDILARSLAIDEGFLNILSQRPGEGPVPEKLLIPRDVRTFKTDATQLGGQISGRLFSWRSIKAEVDAGIARTLESARFDSSVGRSERDVTSFFSRVRLPLIRGSGDSALREWELDLGLRRDFYNDVRDVTTWQSSLGWQPRRGIEFHAAYSTLFRPPSLYELYFPPTQHPFQIFDPQRNEVTAISWVRGGNASLHPTEGEAVDFGVSIHPSRHWRLSLNYWDTRMRNRVFPVAITDLIDRLNTQDDVQDRIVRDATTGRLLALDTRQANFGALKARGFDLSAQRTFETAVGRITPRIDFTHTVDFRYRNLPASTSPMADRAGIASLYGTIPTQRAVCSVMFERAGLSAAVFARHHNRYKDHSIVAGAATDRHVSAQTLYDLKITADIGEHVTLSFGANNVLDKQAPFALIGGSDGFDTTQGDLLGREAFFDITGSF
jgi:iron complex outermembrane receptor protein